MFYQNTFPKFLEAISIGPNPAFLENNTTNCEFVSAFPLEIELMYDWKSVKRSSNPMNALRNFTKKFIIYGPDLDVQTINFFVKKVKVFPAYYSEVILQEVGYAFDTVKEITEPKDVMPTNPNNTPIQSNFIENNTSIHKDNSFLNKLAQLLAGCKSPCNYFKPRSSSIGTIADFGRAMSDSASVLADAGSEALHAPINIATGVYNKIKPAVKKEFLKLKVSTQNLYRDGVKPFFSKKDRERVKEKSANGETPNSMGRRLPLTGDTDTFMHVSQAHSKVQHHIKEQLGDCFRLFEHGMRYNPYDPEMNAAYSKRKYMGVKNGNVKSLIDILGSQAPAQYATENTFQNSLGPVKNQEYMRYDDAPKAPKYDTYDGPSKGSEAVVTAGGGTTVNPAQAAGATPVAGAGLENVPATGKVMEFGFGEVKLTSYGYMMDECPDTGSEMGLGNATNMIIPLKTVAINPEAYKAYGIKPFDVLIITATDKQGNTFVERRQVGDTSAALGKLGTKFKMVIDEYLPSKKGSKLADRTTQLKLKIQIADTKEPKAKWNVQEASQHAPMFLSRNDWERAKKYGLSSKDATQKGIASKMESEYIKYTKWNENETLKPKFINNKGC
jgi:hypothetical protein